MSSPPARSAEQASAAVSSWCDEDVADVAPLFARTSLERQRSSFRVTTSGGGTYKARVMESAAAAAEQQRWRSGLSSFFAPVLDVRGPVIVEAWVPGQAADEAGLDHATVESLGVLMASLHLGEAPAWQSATDPDTSIQPVVAPFLREVDDLAGLTGRNVDMLTESAVLPEASAARLRKLIAGSPPTAWHGLIHTDICPENIVLHTHPTVIDNEHFRIGAAQMDVARTWFRSDWWDTTAHPWEWDLYTASYRGGGGVIDSDQGFWRVAAAALDAAVRVAGGAPADRAVECLRLLAEAPGQVA